MRQTPEQRRIARLTETIQKAIDDIGALAQLVHQAHHGYGTGTWEGCNQRACLDARIAIAGARHGLEEDR